MSLFLRAMFQIFRFEYFIRRGDFSLICQKVRTAHQGATNSSANEIPEVCASIDSVCIWYPRSVLCLQRSAATTCLLRSRGFPAQMVVGAQQIPFKAHAWVEVEARVVNDKPYVREIYAELERC